MHVFLLSIVYRLSLGPQAKQIIWGLKIALLMASSLLKSRLPVMKDLIRYRNFWLLLVQIGAVLRWEKFLGWKDYLFLWIKFVEHNWNRLSTLFSFKSNLIPPCSAGVFPKVSCSLQKLCASWLLINSLVVAKLSWSGFSSMKKLIGVQFWVVSLDCILQAVVVLTK